MPFDSPIGLTCFDNPQSAREAFAAGLAAVDEWEAALVADNRPPTSAIACPLCDGRGDIETDDTAHCAHVE